MKSLRKYFDWNDSAGRGRLLKAFWIISLFMVVLGYLIIVYLLFR